MVYIKQVLNLSILRKGNIKCNTLLIFLFRKVKKGRRKWGHCFIDTCNFVGLLYFHILNLPKKNTPFNMNLLFIIDFLIHVHIDRFPGTMRNNAFEDRIKLPNVKFLIKLFFFLLYVKRKKSCSWIYMHTKLFETDKIVIELV